MDKNKLNLRQTRQKKYRQNQDTKGLVRFEIQLPANTKARFDELVEAVADEYAEPYDKRQRIAKARVQVFEEITKNIQHEFFELKDKIQFLKEEIKALSPNFFKIKIDNTPLPEAISTLPDDPEKLKQLLAKLYRGLQAAQQFAAEQKRQATQFEQLYNAMSNYNDKLKQELDIE